MDECVFCRIAAGQIPASWVHRDERVMAFMDIGQVNLGHVLVATRAHVENIYGLSDDAAAAVFTAAARIARAIKRETGCEGVSLFQANEKAGYQTVFHFHVHVLPRYRHDGLEVKWPSRNPPRAELDAWAGRLAAALDKG